MSERKKKKKSKSLSSVAKERKDHSTTRLETFRQQPLHCSQTLQKKLWPRACKSRLSGSLGFHLREAIAAAAEIMLGATSWILPAVWRTHLRSHTHLDVKDDQVRSLGSYIHC